MYIVHYYTVLVICTVHDLILICTSYDMVRVCVCVCVCVCSCTVKRQSRAVYINCDSDFVILISFFFRSKSDGTEKINSM